MSGIVCVRVNDTRSWIGLDQYPVALAGFTEKPAIRLTVLRDADMATGHSRIDPVGILPMGGDTSLPVGRLEFERSQSPWHASRARRWRSVILGIGRTEQHQRRDADGCDP
jgi:hypothetical protein